MLGSKSERGITQMSLDVLFSSISSTIRNPDSPTNPDLLLSIAASDPSEAQIFSARSFLESIYNDPYGDRGRGSRAQTPMVSSRSQTPVMVWNSLQSAFLAHSTKPFSSISPDADMSRQPKHNTTSKNTNSPLKHLLNTKKLDGYNTKENKTPTLPSQLPFWNSHKTVNRANKLTSRKLKESTSLNFPRRQLPQRPSALPQLPDVGEFAVPVSRGEEHVVLVSMYEVYNDRIFDLLSPAVGGTATRQTPGQQKDRRRHLLFKSTEGSPDRKVVAGLRKIACSTYEEALMILETGLTERRVAGTGSNSVSSRSHGFFCVEVKRKVVDRKFGEVSWVGNTLTVVDLAGNISYLCFFFLLL